MPDFLGSNQVFAAQKKLSNVLLAIINNSWLACREIKHNEMDTVKSIQQILGHIRTVSASLLLIKKATPARLKNTRNVKKKTKIKYIYADKKACVELRAAKYYKYRMVPTFAQTAIAPDFYWSRNFDSD